MNWQLTVEKNRDALVRILAMLAAMVAVAANGDGDACVTRRKTLPRHLHRYVLRLLRPAEAATRRLIIVAAYGLKVEISAVRQRKPKPLPQPRTVYVLDRVNGSIVSVPMVVQEPAQIAPSNRGAKRAISVTFPLFDPAMRFRNRRRSLRPVTMPSISLIGGDPRIPASLQITERPRRPLPPPPSEDDEIDAMRLHRRLEAIDRALGDLPGQAHRFARWQARRDAILTRRRRCGGRRGGQRWAGRQWPPTSWSGR